MDIKFIHTVNHNIYQICFLLLYPHQYLGLWKFTFSGTLGRMMNSC